MISSDLINYIYKFSSINIHGSLERRRKIRSNEEVNKISPRALSYTSSISSMLQEQWYRIIDYQRRTREATVVGGNKKFSFPRVLKRCRSTAGEIGAPRRKGNVFRVRVRLFIGFGAVQSSKKFRRRRMFLVADLESTDSHGESVLAAWHPFKPRLNPA